MKISARASGGFAGRDQTVELDTTARPDGAALEALLGRLDFFSAAPACAVGADLPRWEITVEDGARCHTVFLSDDGGTASDVGSHVGDSAGNHADLIAGNGAGNSAGTSAGNSADWQTLLGHLRRLA
jgi:hypothetical protein